MPSATHSLNWARVGASSVPLKPPMAMTDLPVASSSEAADWEPLVAAAQVVVVFASKAVSSLLAEAIHHHIPPALSLACLGR